MPQTQMTFMNYLNTINNVYTIIIVVLLTTFSYLQITKWKPLDTVMAYEDIVSNFNAWDSIVRDYETLESSKLKSLTPYMRNYSSYTCVDYGLYYLPVSLQTVNGLLLPTAIRRGDGDGWIVTKSSASDPAALQQCIYLAYKFGDNTISCGSDMYNKLGYAGYMNSDHWCNTVRGSLYTAYRVPE